MNTQNNKVDRYLDRLYEVGGWKHRRIGFSQIIWSAMPFCALGLGIWSLYGAGTERALTVAHSVTWAFIMLDAAILGIFALIGILRQVVENKEPLMSDRFLFISTKTNWLGNFTSRTDVSMYLALSIMAVWPVTIVCLSILLFVELFSRQSIKNNMSARRKVLEQVDEADLHAIFATKEEQAAVGQDIDDMFRVDVE